MSVSVLYYRGKQVSLGVFVVFLASLRAVREGDAHVKSKSFDRLLAQHSTRSKYVYRGGNSRFCVHQRPCALLD
jgi:hypothetical protein